ncbi:MAG: hypothetical protein AAGC54_13080 [Cyanobacteria bacterium P01_F01_bin.4]
MPPETFQGLLDVATISAAVIVLGPILWWVLPDRRTPAHRLGRLL